MPTDDDEVQARAFELMKELVNLTGEKWVTALRFNTLADRARVEDVQARVVFLTAVRRLLQNIPVKIFADADIRLSILHAVQEALDMAIEQEEEQA